MATKAKTVRVDAAMKIAAEWYADGWNHIDEIGRLREALKHSKRVMIVLKKLDGICLFGATQIAKSKAKSWRDYAKEKWNSEEFRDWAYTNLHNFNGVILDSWNLHQSFAQFERENPKFKWPTNYPFAPKRRRR